MGLAGSTVLVTGGAGFIGSHVVDELVARGVRRLIVVDTLWLGKTENIQEAAAHHPNLELLQFNAQDYFAMKAIFDREQVDVVFNMATRPLNYSFDHPRGAYMTSVEIAANLAELLKSSAFGRLVHFSTSEVYGDALEAPMTERHPTYPTTPYAAGKLAADLLLRSYNELFRIPVLIVRPFNNYGPRQNDGEYPAVIPLTIRRLLSGQAPVLEGSGEQTRDFTYVRDTARLALALSETDSAWGDTYHIAHGTEVRIDQLIEAICKLMGYDGAIERRPVRRGDHRRHLADTTRAQALVPFGPLTPLEVGLSATVEWYARRAAKSAAV